MRLRMIENFGDNSTTLDIEALVMLDVSIASAPKRKLHEDDDYGPSKEQLVKFVTENNGHCIGWKRDEHGVIEGQAIVLLPPSAIDILETSRDITFIEWDKPIAGEEIAIIGFPQGQSPNILKRIINAEGHYTISLDDPLRTYHPQDSFPENNTDVELAHYRRTEASFADAAARPGGTD